MLMVNSDMQLLNDTVTMNDVTFHHSCIDDYTAKDQELNLLVYFQSIKLNFEPEDVEKCLVSTIECL